MLKHVRFTIRGMTQHDLADKAKIDQGWLSKVERSRDSFARTTAERVAAALNVPFNIIFVRADDDPRRYVRRKRSDKLEKAAAKVTK